MIKNEYFINYCSRVCVVSKVLSRLAFRGKARLLAPPTALPDAVPRSGLHLRLCLRLEYAEVWQRETTDATLSAASAYALAAVQRGAALWDQQRSGTSIKVGAFVQACLCFRGKNSLPLNRRPVSDCIFTPYCLFMFINSMVISLLSSVLYFRPLGQ